MAGNSRISNPMNRNTQVDGSKNVVRDERELEELILEYYDPEEISCCNLDFEDVLEDFHEKPEILKFSFNVSRNGSGDTDIDEPEKDPRNYGANSEEPEKDPEDERKTDSPEESFSPNLSFHSRDMSEKIVGQIRTMSEEFAPESSSDLSESDQSFSKEKKRPRKLEASESGKMKAFQLRKKCRYKDSIKPESAAIGDASEELTSERVSSKVIGHRDENVSELEELAGYFGKPRHTMCSSETDVAKGGDDSTSERKRTKLACHDPKLKMLGPLDLPDFMGNFSESELDPDVKLLKMKLLEINIRLLSPYLHDDRPEEERFPSPEPVYNNLGIRINTREVRLRRKLTNECARITSKLVKKNPIFKTPPKLKPNKLFKKIYVPVKLYPTYNFIGLIIGPRGNTQKKMEKESGAKISLRGKGSARSSKKRGPFYDDDLHVYVEADNQKALNAAVEMIEKLLIPVADWENKHKRAQLAELAKLNGTCSGEDICREQVQKDYIYSGRKSTFKELSCQTCGSFCHLVSECPLSITSYICQPSCCSSDVCIGSTPNMERKCIKQIDATKLFVEPERLKELFLTFGKISEANVIEDPCTDSDKGDGFVKFKNLTDAASAVAYLNEYKMDGKMLPVRVARDMALADHLPLSNLDLSSWPMASSSINGLASSCLDSMSPQT
ncbi:hypothetical protein M9H77_29906 [Catharanthus roseus]|uniref:Uncharacterized protein n=1 Tax=Catharanthus roseus TaxID=4058 RepID=A0ACB9ZW22_CATRO|nr:hypothetical protein M9H77_29906 [Catharanthus roseus]